MICLVFYFFFEVEEFGNVIVFLVKGMFSDIDLVFILFDVDCLEFVSNDDFGDLIDF